MKKNIAGVDEVGRGSLIGPVFAAAVIFKEKIDKSIIKDSKKLSKKRRENLEKYIKKLEEKMNELAAKLEFEDAAKIRDEINRLKTKQIGLNKGLQK